MHSDSPTVFPFLATVHCIQFVVNLSASILPQYTMFSAVISAVRGAVPDVARGFASSAARSAGRKFFVGGNWKCNGSVSKVCYHPSLSKQVVILGNTCGGSAVNNWLRCGKFSANLSWKYSARVGQ